MVYVPIFYILKIDKFFLVYGVLLFIITVLFVLLIKYLSFATRITVRLL